MQGAVALLQQLSMGNRLTGRRWRYMAVTGRPGEQCGPVPIGRRKGTTMNLTNHERRELAQLERALRQEDPELAELLESTTLSCPAPRARRTFRWLRRR
jgi:hypothetical protein